MSGHGTHIAQQTVESGAQAAKPADPSEDEWIFSGWYSDMTFQTAFDFDSAITADTTLYAKWVSNSVTPPPSTVDNSIMVVLLMLFSASCAGLIVLSKNGRKKKQN